MRQANKRKRAPERKVQENENVQPALVNSATASAAAPLPEGNWKDIAAKVRKQTQDLSADRPPDERRAYSLFANEFEARARAMPFIRFVAVGDAMPVEIGNVDKLQAPDGSGTYYMFPTSENLRMAFAGEPEDPTQGQEAQGGPLHGITGRGEKYAGGNVETDVLLDSAKNPQWDGKGSQTGGTGVQRASLGDEAAVGGAVDDTQVSNVADYGEGHTRPLAKGTVLTQVEKTREDEPGLIVRTTDVSKLRTKGSAFKVVKDKDAPPQTGEKANIDSGQAHLEGPGTKGKPTIVDTRVADQMKEGQKTATDAAAAGAVTAGNSASDIEQESPGIVGGFGGKQSEDASEGTRLDTLSPTVEEVHYPQHLPGSLIDNDWSSQSDEEITKFLEEHNVPIQTGAKRTDLIAMANSTATKAGRDLAVQKSDEATPQNAGGVAAGEPAVNIAPAIDPKAPALDTYQPEPTKIEPPKETKPKSSKAKTTKKGTKLSLGKKKASSKKSKAKAADKNETKPSTSKAATGEDSASHEEQKAAEPGAIKPAGEETADEDKS